MTPSQEAKARVYRELGYRPAGMVGEHLPVARPLVRDTKGSASRSSSRADGEDVDSVSLEGHIRCIHTP